MKTLVIIPAYNEAQRIAEVIKETLALGVNVLVIDDGSRDATSQAAGAAGAAVIRKDENRGKGAALRDGFCFALKNNYDAVVTIDGDGQHNPQDLPKFLAGLDNPEIAVVIGNRMHKPQGMPALRFLTNKFMSLVLSRICHQDIPDSQCGYRLVKRQILEKINLSTKRYEIESELLVRASRMAYQILSVPIESIYPGTKSQIHPIVDTLRFLRFIFKELWTSPN